MKLYKVTEISERRKLAFPYLLILAIFSISVLILNLGWSAVSRQRQQQAALNRDDEARQILGTMVYGSDINPYLTRIAKYLKTRLPAELAARKTNSAVASRGFLQKSFPEHEIWAFALPDSGRSRDAQTLIFPDNSTVSRRGMANAFAALDSADENSKNDKLIDYLFGPGLTVRSLSLRQGVPTRIIYRNRHHMLIWDRLTENDRQVGGFFLLVPDSSELRKYAMNISARSANFGRFHPGNVIDKRCLAGYLRIFPQGFASILPDSIKEHSEVGNFLQEYEQRANLAELERAPLPWAVRVGEWELYTNVIPNSSHMAFVLLPQSPLIMDVPVMLVLGNWIYVAVTLLFLAAYFSGWAFPPLSLKSRFSLLFFLLAAIPFSLFLLAAVMYLEELRITMLREARQKMFVALSSFDQSVEDVYQLYRSEIQKLQHQKWLVEAMKDAEAPGEDLLRKVETFLMELSPPLPWGSLLFLNSDGKTVEAFRSAEHQRKLAGYNKFNRMGMLDAVRKIRGMPDLEQVDDLKHVSESDVAVKTAFETLVRLPVSHGFLNKSIGQPAQVAFGSFSIVRIFDYFPSAQEPELAFGVAWLEEELDRHFCDLTLGRLHREYPGSRFAVFRSEDDGMKLIARTHEDADLAQNAFAASLRNGFSFAQSRKSARLEIAFSSQRRPGIILAGEMDAGYIDNKLYQLTRYFLLFAVIGLLTILFFQRLLAARLIVPFMLLQKSLANVTGGDLVKLPSLQRCDEVFHIFTAFNEMIDGLKTRQRLLSLVSGKALQLAAGKKMTDLSASSGIVPVIAMISDVRDFTGSCENYPPDVITRLLNTHFDRMTRIIHAYGGEVTRFVGDAIEASFPYDADAAADSFKRAAAAGITMLQTMSLINEERERQKLFAYQIGIGLSCGNSHVFCVGGSGTRSDVLHVGEPFKKAAVLEALSKKFDGYPLVMDSEIGDVLGGLAEYNGAVKHQKIDGINFSGFIRLPEQEILLADSEAVTAPSNFRFHNSYRNLVSTVGRRVAGFWPGLILLTIPFLIILFGINSGFSRYRQDLIQVSRQKAQQVLANQKIYLARKEKVEMQLHKTIAAFPDTLSSGVSPFDKNNRKEWKGRIARELHESGLKPEEIVFVSLENSKTASGNQLADQSKRRLEEQLGDLLGECLSCYGQLFNRFLQPDPEKIALLGDSMSGLLLTRDTRSRFESVIIASESFWIYWQPVLDLRLLQDYRNNMYRLWSRNVFDEMSLFGRFSQADYGRFLLGGVLVLCHPPVKMEQLRYRHDESTTLSAQIDLKDKKVIEEHGNLDLLLDEAGSLVTSTDRSEKLVAVAHHPDREKTGWIIEKSLSGGDRPVVDVAAVKVPAMRTGLALLEQLGYFMACILSALAVYFWYLALNERFASATVNRQIFGSFLAVILLPVSGIFMVLVFLVGDWQVNLLKESESGFVRQVDSIEQKVRLHHFAGPQKVQHALENSCLKSLLLREVTVEKDGVIFTEVRQKLHEFLEAAYQQIMVRSQALGVGSIMVDSLNGLSEFLVIDGTLSPENDPMKRAFSFHSNRVMERLGRFTGNQLLPRDANKMLVDEMTARIIFEIIDSTFGSDAAIEILFGQGRGVELFSSVSNDVLFQHHIPDSANPMATIFTIFAHLPSNQFAMARIIAARHFNHRSSVGLEFEVYAASKLTPGLPLLPETAETMPFIREIARQTMLTGNATDMIEKDGREYHLITHSSIVAPQFIFVGIADKAEFSSVIASRLIQFMAILMLFFVMLLLLSMNTARDITGPLAQLLAAIEKVKAGNYQTALSFNRQDELERIAVEFNEMAQRLAEKDVLARMVSESALAMANSDQGEKDARFGMRREAAVLFLGIVGFDDFMRVNDASVVSDRLAVWVERVCEEIVASGGEVDKIMEGKILAVFFADSDRETFVRRAFCTGSSVTAKISDQIPTAGGVAVGTVVAGLMGNERRRDFTVIGDPVNMAARFFAVSEKLGRSGLVTDSAVEIPAADFVVTDLGEQVIKGKEKPLRLAHVGLKDSDSLPQPD